MSNLYTVFGLIFNPLILPSNTIPRCIKVDLYPNNNQLYIANDNILSTLNNTNYLIL